MIFNCIYFHENKITCTSPFLHEKTWRLWKTDKRLDSEMTVFPKSLSKQNYIKYVTHCPVKNK